MSQAALVTASGSGLAVRTAINAAIARLATRASGTARPSDIATGEEWIETDNPGSGVWSVWKWDGASDILLGVINSTTHAWTPAGASPEVATAPTYQKFTTGTAATYTTPANVKWIKIRMVGGGGGGSGTGASPGAGGNGGNTTWSGGTLVAGGGAGGGAGTMAGGAGGTATGGNGPNIVGEQGGFGSDLIAAGGVNRGGSSMLGAGAANGPSTAAEPAAGANTGGGGPGGHGTTSQGGGAGGGAGGYVEHVIGAPAATYTYTIGAAGALGGNGKAGGSGFIIVEEHYNY